MMAHDLYENCSEGSDHQQMDCVETTITSACGTWGVYGPTLVDERADRDTCVCQMLKKHSTERLHYAERACPQFLPKLLCIHNFVKVGATYLKKGFVPKRCLKCDQEDVPFRR